MTLALKASSQRVQDFLDQHGVELKVKQMTESTRTAAEAADALGCQIGQIAKSLIFKNKATGTPVLLVASGANRVDTKKVEKATGIKLGRADADYVRENVGYVIGGVPPIAHSQALTTYLDPDLQNYSTVWAAAGTPNSMFELACDQLEKLTQGAWIEMAQ